MSKILIDKIEDFNLEHIFECGQCFRWNREIDGSYTGVAKGKVANMSFSGSSLTIDNADAADFENIWKNYLDIHTDYGEIKKKLSQNDEAMKRAIMEGYGIRILNQELWETIVSFIISANNNIPRIKGCIEKLCENFGAYIGTYKGKKRYAFPTPEKIAELSIDELMACKLGYRARYIIESAKLYIWKKDEFEALAREDVTYATAFDKIRQLNGVGPKVANCILLFGLGKRDSFPIDVWMKRVMNFLYGIHEDNVREMEEYAVKHFGDDAGIAQQYLFFYMRNKSIGGK